MHVCVYTSHTQTEREQEERKRDRKVRRETNFKEGNHQEGMRRLERRFSGPHRGSKSDFQQSYGILQQSTAQVLTVSMSLSDLHIC